MKSHVLIGCVAACAFAACGGAASRRAAAPRPASPHVDPNAAALGLTLQAGFRVSEIADANLADNIFSLAVTPAGEIAVSSAGWIKLLHDRDRDGRADAATVFAETQSGSMGLLFEADAVYSFQDRALVRYAVTGDPPRAAGPPERLMDLGFSEHGGHGLRRGPDGWLYFLVGNDAGVSAGHVRGARSPIARPSQGALIRLSPDHRVREIVADGLRNAYRFDLLPDGGVVAYEADGERDVGLPWYQPTRLLHLAHGAHHGWLLEGWRRSFVRPDDYPDAVPYLLRVGLGSPTGLVAYRHTALPARYRAGLFLADWTWGRVSFVPLQPRGAGHAAGAPEIVLGSAGTEGFAPTDLAVAPDGALLIAIGGRGTRGGVYRLTWADARDQGRDGAADRVAAVLRAPQPLEPWSRARWTPLARALGAAPFEAVAADERAPVADRVRAVEILTELFAPSPATLSRLVASASGEVRARAAWSLGRRPAQGAGALLARLARDADPRVRVRALEALGDTARDAAGAEIDGAVLEALAHDDRRVRLAGAWLGSVLPAPRWTAIERQAAAASMRVRLGAALVSVWRAPDGRQRGLARAPEARDAVVRTALAALSSPAAVEETFFAVRLAALALGDWATEAPPREVYVPYAPAVAPPPDLAARVLAAAGPRFPSGDARLDEELARLFAMLEAGDADLPARIAARWTAQSAPASDAHYLIVLSRLPGARTAEVTRRTADALITVTTKLGRGGAHALQNWEERLGETRRELLRRDRALGTAIAEHPRLVDTAQVPLALALDSAERLRVARRFLAAVTDGGLALTEPTLSLLGELPAGELRPILRRAWEDPGLRDAAVTALARAPQPEDRARFVAALGSFHPTAVLAALDALAQLPPARDAATASALVTLLRRSTADPADRARRARVRGLIEREAGRRFAVQDTAGDRAALQQAHAPIFDWFAAKFPSAEDGAAAGTESPAALLARLRGVAWDGGDAARGAQVVTQRACLSCHGGLRALGPSLAGSAARMSREDLFVAIAFPDRDVSPTYRALVVQTKSGDVHTGTVVYDSPEVLILKTGPTTTIRLAGADIAARRASESSLMPAGLLEGLTPVELADMYAYLRTLR